MEQLLNDMQFIKTDEEYCIEKWSLLLDNITYNLTITRTMTDRDMFIIIDEDNKVMCSVKNGDDNYLKTCLLSFMKPILRKKKLIYYSMDKMLSELGFIMIREKGRIKSYQVCLNNDIYSISISTQTDMDNKMLISRNAECVLDSDFGDENYLISCVFNTFKHIIRKQKIEKLLNG